MRAWDSAFVRACVHAYGRAWVSEQERECESARASAKALAWESAFVRGCVRAYGRGCLSEQERECECESACVGERVRACMRPSESVCA